MKDYPYVPGWRLNKQNNKPAIKHSILMLTTHGVAEGEWDGSDWAQYRWSCIVKDSDVLYWMHLEDLTQLEKEDDPIPQEIDIEKEMDKLVSLEYINQPDDEWDMCIASHFYELGLNARKEE